MLALTLHVEHVVSGFLFVVVQEDHRVQPLSVHLALIQDDDVVVVVWCSLRGVFCVCVVEVLLNLIVRDVSVIYFKCYQR